MFYVYTFMVLSLQSCTRMHGVRFASICAGFESRFSPLHILYHVTRSSRIRPSSVRRQPRLHEITHFFSSSCMDEGIRKYVPLILPLEPALVVGSTTLFRVRNRRPGLSRLRLSAFLLRPCAVLSGISVGSLDACVIGRPGLPYLAPGSPCFIVSWPALSLLHP